MEPAAAAQVALWAIAALLLFRWAGTEIVAHDYQVAAARVLADARRPIARTLATPEPPRLERSRVRAAPEIGVVGRLRIPRIGVSAMIAEGVQPRVLDRALGHVPGTALPGEAGNVGIAGHRDTFLQRLARVRRGDRIRVTTPHGTYEYRVTRMRVVSPRAVEVLRGTREPRLTLVTCYPFHAIGPAPRRFVVQAQLHEPARRPRADATRTAAASRSR